MQKAKDKRELDNRHKNFRRAMQVRIKEIDDKNPKKIIEGKAVTFDEATTLFEIDGVKYKEIIDRHAFDNTDISQAFLKYNHSDNIMAMARVKNKTLNIEIRDDGVYMTAELANTTAGNDLYELVKRGDIDKMSFAFTVRAEEHNKETNTWTVKDIDTLYDVAAVTIPAYDNTQLYARRVEDVEALKQQYLDELALQKERKRVMNLINIKGDKKC